MTPLPGALGGRELVAWRLDDARFASTWDSGEGAYLFGGRWNSPGTRVVYCSIDPSTAILEVAVHTGIAELDTRARVLSSLIIDQPSDVHVLDRQDLLAVSGPEAARQGLGDALLATHRLIVLPSVVSPNSWNLLISIPAATGRYRLQSQEPFAIDPRLRTK